jgi:glucoamylase
VPRRAYQRVQAAISQIDLVGLAPTMLAFMKANIASQALVFQDQHGVRSKPGCVIASPSYSGVTDQDYVHHWVRDAAITAVEIASSLALGNGVDQTLCDYVAFSATCQGNVDSDPKVGFFRACFNIDGTPRDRWSDQKDGPALQSLAFVQAWPYLETNAKVTATKVAQRNLDETVGDWQNDIEKLGPWEDNVGPSFFTRAAQVRFLEEVATANILGLSKPAGFHAAFDGLRNALGTHWDDAQAYYRSIPGGQPGSASTDISGYDPNADVVMACTYGSIPCTDPKLLATAAKLRGAFDVAGSVGYPINKDDRDRGFGPMVGRYPSDTYDGDTSDTVNTGHPWALCTANFAQLYYCLAKTFRAGYGVPYDKLTGPFFDQLGLDETTVNDAGQIKTVADALRTAGDKMLQAVIFHSDHYRLSEQFDSATGYEKSVQDLTWSYAAYLSAVRERS